MADTTATLTVRRRFDVPAERVFDAWLDMTTARKWLFTAPGGEVVRAENDPRVGGTFCIVDRRDGQDFEHMGEYLELDRPRRLVFTFAVDGSPGDRVTVDLVPVPGGCELVLTHETGGELGDAEAGWTMILDGLAMQLA